MVIENAIEATKSTSSPQRVAKDRRDGAELVVSAVVEESEVISSTTPSSPAAKPTKESRLWTIASSSTSATTISISRSSLFGVGISGERAQERGVSPSSSIGGKETYFSTGSVFGSALAKVSFVV